MTDSNNLKAIFKKLDSLNHVVAPNEQSSNLDDQADSASNVTSDVQDSTLHDKKANQNQGPNTKALKHDDEWKIPKTAKEIQKQLLTLISPEFVNLHPADPKELAKLPDFPCDGCGLCCVRVDSSPYLVGLESKRKDGICRYFDIKSKKCLIYKYRPLICNVKEGYLALFKDNMSVYDFYFENMKACNGLKEAYAQGKLIKIPHQKI